MNFLCEELDFTDSWVGIQSAYLSYCYYIVKLLDLFDTVFFVLRKRTRQISFLHVYHHVAILLGAFICVTWAPGKSFAMEKQRKPIFSCEKSYLSKCFKFLLHSFRLGGHPWIFGLLNCIVHVFMYSYYFGSVFNPKLKTNLTIKRSITQMQIVSHTFN